MADRDADGARSRLREVALELFGRHGIRDTSTRQILRAAGLRNPSAITYHFGSKAELIEDLVHELYGGQTPVLQRQIELAESSETPSIAEWVAIAVDSSSTLISTERGCLLARIWWEYDGYIHPSVFEEYLNSGHPMTTRWLDAADKTFADLPRYVAVTRNVVMLRTLEWMIARRAGRILTGEPSDALQMDSPEAFRQLMFEVALGIATTPTELTEADIRFGE
jgi:AcrR family transcriptional regulator